MLHININQQEKVIFQSRLDYTLDFINAHPLTKYYDVHFSLEDGESRRSLTYGSKPIVDNSNIHIHQTLCLFQVNPSVDKYSIGSYLFKNKIYYYASPHESSIDTIAPLYSMPFDIFESIFFFISRYEEIFNSQELNSEIGWLEEKEHILIKNNISHVPVVDQLIELLLRFIGIEHIAMPSTTDLTHDLDILRRFPNAFYFIRSLLASIYYKRGLKQIQRDSRHFFNMKVKGVKDPYDSFDFLLNTSSKWKSKILYIMAGGNTKYDNKYTLGNPNLKDVLNLAQSRGYLIGLHPSFNSPFNIDMFRAERNTLASVLGKAVVWNRQHRLRFNWQVTPQIYAELGLEHDSSMGYNRHIGFRCGTGFPYYMYNFYNESRYPWIEHPIALMDSSAIQIYRLNNNVGLTEIVHDFININRENTHLTLNFHNSNFDETLVHGRELKIIFEGLCQSMQN